LEAGSGHKKGLEAVGKSYIVTDRGGSRSYATLVTVDGPPGDLYLKAQREAARCNRDLADCGNEVSAFPISEAKRKTWLLLEAEYKAAVDGLPETLDETRRLQGERQLFLSKL